MIWVEVKAISHHHHHRHRTAASLFIFLFLFVAVWLLLSYLSNGRKHLSAAILSVFSFVNAAIYILMKDDFMQSLEFAIKYDGATALVITMIMTIDKVAWKHALILIFAVACHSMILLHLITDSYFMWAISKPFYALYDELIIIVSLLQMWVSHDGMVKGLNSTFRVLQGVLFRFVFHSYRIRKSLLTQAKIKDRT